MALAFHSSRLRPTLDLGVRDLCARKGLSRLLFLLGLMRLLPSLMTGYRCEKGVCLVRSSRFLKPTLFRVDSQGAFCTLSFSVCIRVCARALTAPPSLGSLALPPCWAGAVPGRMSEP